MNDFSDRPSPDHTEVPIDIDPSGDLLLRFRDDGAGTLSLYRVSTTALRRASTYFQVLLDPLKFSEGIAVDRRLKAIQRQHGKTEAIAFLELPVIYIPDIGQVPRGVSTESAVTLFFHILHDEETSWPSPRPSFVALLAIIADRFDAATPIARYVIQRNWKSKMVAQKGSSLMTEVRLRQQLLIGLILRFPDWVRQYSASLIVQGSAKWTAQGEEAKEEEGLWWNFPNNLEGKVKAGHCRKATLSFFLLLSSRF